MPSTLYFERNLIAFLFLLPDINESSEFSTGKSQSTNSSNFQKTETYVGFTFLVLHPIVTHSLNVLRDFVTTSDSLVRVSLLNSVNREKVVSATFSINENVSGSDILEKTVDPYVLPKGFEGQIIVELKGNKSGQSNLKQPDCWLQWNNASGLITFLQLIRYVNEKPVPFQYTSCTFASLTFTIHGNSLRYSICPNIRLFYSIGIVQNVMIPCHSQELLLFLPVIYFFLPLFSINCCSILPHFI
jgi:hypothetical protein